MVSPGRYLQRSGWIFALTAQGLLAAFTADLSRGNIAIKLEAQPEAVAAAHDLILDLTIESPANLLVTLPDLRERFSGFSRAEEFTTEPLEVGGRRILRQRWLLTPEPAPPRYRLAPFAVTITDRDAPSQAPESFATLPVVFPALAPLQGVAGAAEVKLEPLYVRPTWRSIMLWSSLGLGGLLLLALLLYGLTRLSLRVREYRMSPVERALVELQRLLGRHLPERQLFKEFYIELTMVVRRYIERTRGIRAPGQTTQEFLAVATRHTSFTPAQVADLKRFLESADMVKFAGREATLAMTEEATSRARAYLESDTREARGEAGE